MCRPKLRMRYRMSVIYGHPVMAATRALRFSDHVTKRNGGSGDENGIRVSGDAQNVCAITIVGTVLTFVSTFTNICGDFLFVLLFKC